MSSPPLDRTAAMAVGIAATAMPFAASREEEAERWLRILRMHGETSLILSSLGVTEGSTQDGPAGGPDAGERPGDGGQDAVARVSEGAAAHARERGSEAVTTRDLLLSVMDVYGAAFDRVLEGHGTSRDDLVSVLDLPADGEELTP